MSDLMQRLAKALTNAMHKSSTLGYMEDTLLDYVTIDGTYDMVSAISAILSELDAAGYAIVPKEPTAEMIEAGNHWAEHALCEDAYTSMLDAAPKVVE